MGGCFRGSPGKGKMFTRALSKDAQTALALLGKSGILNDAYLAGGTACALQLGHRLSFDLDFFTPKEFEISGMIETLKKTVGLRLERSARGTILGKIKDTRFSLFSYQPKPIFPLKRFLGVDILDLRDIAAMKVAAVSDRGARRDFIDLYFICKRKIALGDIFKFYDKKYGKLAANLIHIQKSLVYFIDAEGDEMPRMLKSCKWEEVKSFFEQKVKKIVIGEEKRLEKYLKKGREKK